MSPMLLPAAGVPIVRFSAEVFPERDRYAMWHESLRRHIVGLDIEPLIKDRLWDHVGVGMVLPGLGVVISKRTGIPQTDSSLS